MYVKPGTLLGKYKITSLLGAGGMGEVYLAQDTQLRRPVALKLLPSDLTLNEDRLVRFEQEALLASALNHPNILTIYEVGQVESLHFIATEFIDGLTLRKCIKNSQMELRKVLNVAVQVASALSAAHQAGIVHRDIKPENIMVRHDGYVKVLDFGLAKLTQHQGIVVEPEAKTMEVVRTDPGAVMGTVTYMSPEQARGLLVDERTDTWALGVVIYEMVSAKAPFDGSTNSDVMAAILRAEPLWSTRVWQNVPSELQWIVKKALRKDKRERYQTIKDVELDLKNLHREVEGEGKTAAFVKQELRSLAILPFRNLTNDQTVGFYEFSLADAVITELARLRSLVVRPSSAIAKYVAQQKDPIEAGQELRVKAVLSANFLHTRERVRVTTQLLDVASGDVLWADRIDSNAGDIISVQDMIVSRIVEGLQLKLGPGEHVDLLAHATPNAPAYEQYLRGSDRTYRYVYHTVANDDIEAAIRHFQRAIEFDPRFALAHCALGGCYIQRILKAAGNANDLECAEEALNKGLALDAGIIEARVHMVHVYLLRGNKLEARRQISDLERQTPYNANVHFVSGILHRLDGEYNKALNSFESMSRLNPASHVVAGWNRARIAMYQGRYGDALLELRQSERTEPDHPVIQTYIGEVLYYSGEIEAATQILQEVLRRHPTLDGIRPLLAMCLSALGQHESARAQLTERVKETAITDWDVPYWLASAYAMEGQRDEAFEWLEKAITLGNENVSWFKSNPVWKPLRHESRFKELMHRIETRHALKDGPEVSH
jgi:eukaryotic-like serine/threonine-protein kinase